MSPQYPYKLENIEENMNLEAQQISDLVPSAQLSTTTGCERNKVEGTLESHNLTSVFYKHFDLSL